MAGTCEYCGSQLKDGEKICHACGAKTEQQPVSAQPRQQPQPQRIYQQPQQPQKTYQQPPQRRAAVKTRRPVAFRVIACVLICALTVTAAVKLLPGNIIKGGTGDIITGEYDPGKIVETESAAVNAGSPVVTLSGVTVDTNRFNLTGGEQQLTVSRHEVSKDELGRKSIQYDVEMGGGEDSAHGLTASAELTFTYDKKDADNGRVSVQHYDSEYGLWVPLRVKAETDESVTVSTSSFSPFRLTFSDKANSNDTLFYVANEKTNKAQFVLNDDVLGDLLDSDSINTAVEIINNYMATGNADAAVSWLKDGADKVNTVNTYYTLLGALGDSTASVLGDAYGTGTAVGLAAGKVSKGIGVASLLLAATQLAFDVADKGLRAQETAVNLMKNLATNGGTIYGLATGYSSAALSLSFLGVALFGYGLDIAVAYATDIKETTIKSVYEAYYEQFGDFNEAEWIELFNDAYNASKRSTELDESGRIDYAINQVKATMDRYAEKFWTDIHPGGDALTFTLIEAGKEFTYTPTDAQRKSLTDSFRLNMYERFNDNVIPEIKENMLNKLQADITAELYHLCAPYNQIYKVQIKELAPQMTTEECEFQDSVIRFSNGEEFAAAFTDTVGTWYLKTPKSSDEWEVESEFTLLAYMLAGCPDRIYIYTPGSDPNDHDYYDKIKSLNLTLPENDNIFTQSLTVIDLSKVTEDELLTFFPVTSISMYYDGAKEDEYKPEAGFDTLIDMAFVNASPISVVNQNGATTFTVPAWSYSYVFDVEGYESRVYDYNVSAMTFRGQFDLDMLEGNFDVSWSGCSVYDRYMKCLTTYRIKSATATAVDNYKDGENWKITISVDCTMTRKWDDYDETETFNKKYTADVIVYTVRS